MAQKLTLKAVREALDQAIREGAFDLSKPEVRARMEACKESQEKALAAMKVRKETWDFVFSR